MQAPTYARLVEDPRLTGGHESFENLRTVSQSNGLWGESPLYVNLVSL